jgi:HlyD family secretion protein
LARDRAGTPTVRDQALSNYRQSEARIRELQGQISQMEAALTGASYNLTQRQVIAQTEGPVQDIYFREGEYAPASTPVVSILPPGNVFVRFFVPETEFARIHLGGKVRITCDGCRPMEATVTFIASREEFTQPIIFSVGNREKLVFKAEARLPGGLPVHPGQPVEVRPL